MTDNDTNAFLKQLFGTTEEPDKPATGAFTIRPQNPNTTDQENDTWI